MSCPLRAEHRRELAGVRGEHRRLARLDVLERVGVDDHGDAVLEGRAPARRRPPSPPPEPTTQAWTRPSPTTSGCCCLTASATAASPTYRTIPASPHVRAGHAEQRGAGVLRAAGPDADHAPRVLLAVRASVAAAAPRRPRAAAPRAPARAARARCRRGAPRRRPARPGRRGGRPCGSRRSPSAPPRRGRRPTSPVSTSTPLGVSTATTGTPCSSLSASAAFVLAARRGRRSRRSRRRPPRACSSAPSTTRPPARSQRGRALRVGLVAEQPRLDLHAPPRQHRPGPQRVAAVVARAHQQQHPPPVRRPQEVHDRRRQPGRRPLHQRTLGQPRHQLRLRRPDLLDGVRVQHAVTLAGAGAAAPGRVLVDARIARPQAHNPPSAASGPPPSDHDHRLAAGAATALRPTPEEQPMRSGRGSESSLVRRRRSVEPSPHRLSASVAVVRAVTAPRPPSSLDRGRGRGGPGRRARGPAPGPRRPDRGRRAHTGATSTANWLAVTTRITRCRGAPGGAARQRARGPRPDPRRARRRPGPPRAGRGHPPRPRRPARRPRPRVGRRRPSATCSSSPPSSTPRR